MTLKNCYNYEDFRNLAKKKLPSPIFHYIDGGADDEVTLNRNTDAFNDCDLVPNILNSVGEPDLSTTVFGRKISMPLFLSPTAMQSLYDLIGIDLMSDVLKSFKKELPKDDEFQKVVEGLPIIKKLIEILRRLMIVT